MAVNVAQSFRRRGVGFKVKVLEQQSNIGTSRRTRTVPRQRADRFQTACGSFILRLGSKEEEERNGRACLVRDGVEGEEERERRARV